jgi:hypothetical protein
MGNNSGTININIVVSFAQKFPFFFLKIIHYSLGSSKFLVSETRIAHQSYFFY